MTPVVNRLAELYSGQVEVLQLNATEDGEAAFEAGDFPGHPAYVILLPDGEEVWRGFGALGEQALIQQVDRVLEEN